jgi:hypothetical protein
MCCEEPHPKVKIKLTKLEKTFANHRLVRRKEVITMYDPFYQLLNSVHCFVLKIVDLHKYIGPCFSLSYRILVRPSHQGNADLIK